jgi:hypothetical protein
LKANTPPTIEIIEAIDEDHAKLLEVCLIEVIGRADLGRGPLLNLTDGGDGRTTWNDQQKKDHSAKITGQKRSEETKSLMSRSAQKRCETKPRVGNNGGGRKKGSITSVEHRQKLAEAQRGRKQSEATKAKIAATRRGTEARRYMS